MAFKTQRNFSHTFSFTYRDEGEDVTKEVTALFRTMPRKDFVEKVTEELKKGVDTDQATLNVVLVGLSGLVIEDADGKVLNDDQCIEAAKQDPSLNYRLNSEYAEGLRGNSLPAT